MDFRWWSSPSQSTVIPVHLWPNLNKHSFRILQMTWKINTIEVRFFAGFYILFLKLMARMSNSSINYNLAVPIIDNAFWITVLNFDDREISENTPLWKAIPSYRIKRSWLGIRRLLNFSLIDDYNVVREACNHSFNYSKPISLNFTKYSENIMLFNLYITLYKERKKKLCLIKRRNDVVVMNLHNPSLQDSMHVWF